MYEKGRSSEFLRFDTNGGFLNRIVCGSDCGKRKEGEEFIGKEELVEKRRAFERSSIC